MRNGFALATGMALVMVVGCTAGQGAGGGGSSVIDGKADSFGFEFGIFSSDAQYEIDEGSAPLFVAFHDWDEGLRQEYAGHFDLTTFNIDSYETEFASGVFQLYVDGDQPMVLFEGYDGEEVARYPWSVVDGDLHMGGTEFYKLRPSSREEVLGQCEAFQVLDYELEEGFTEYEYPSVYIERDANGILEVQLGAASWESDEMDIEVKTTEGGGLEATVTTSYGNVFVVEIPNESPYRGRALYGDAGEEPHLMANLVCFPPQAAPTPLDVTNFSCTTRREDPNGHLATIRFAVVDLAEPEIADLHWPDEVEYPIAVDPEESYAYTLVGGIADGYLSYEDGRLRIFTDQIGYEFGELVLYENSGFQHGWFRFEMMDPDETSFYTEVDCSLR